MGTAPAIEVNVAFGMSSCWFITALLFQTLFLWDYTSGVCMYTSLEVSGNARLRHSIILLFDVGAVVN